MGAPTNKTFGGRKRRSWHRRKPAAAGDNYRRTLVTSHDFLQPLLFLAGKVRERYLHKVPRYPLFFFFFFAGGDSLD
ncbi:hypothetical protein LY78DRAFT_281722 [Colletotrichum sublineola]|nr:hypothetical protein LY78DRAFT_281722 [Colletotrichum sublineola]